MTDVAVDVTDVSKRFRLYHEKYSSLKERVLRAGRNPYEDFWALRDVNFEVNEGETVGIVGRNGSGKSTLLKCISGILQPTEGRVVVRGQLAALLELGAGFQHELSGRENIYLNASLLGLSTREVNRRFDDIVAFAELEQFIDNQVKYYSSGMYVRLGFAVAVNVDPDVLVIDEVLAVGDENFQHKCLTRIKEFQEDGRTILFVTHAAELVLDICGRAVVLDGGQMIGVGSASEAIELYHHHLGTFGAEGAESATEAGPKRLRILGVEVDHPGLGSRAHIIAGEQMTVQVPFEALEPTDGIAFRITVENEGGHLIYSSSTADLEQLYDAPVGRGRVDFTVEQVPLLDGTYTVGIEITDNNGLVVDSAERAVPFEVMNPRKARGTVALDVRAEIRSTILG